MKKRFFSILMMCFLAITICLTGCGKEGLKNNPPKEATIYSNGGMSVIKGDYLYFVNGYIDETTLTKDDNQEGKVFKSAIYRTKLNNNEIDKDKDGFLTNADLVVSKIVGFSNGGFSIIDNHIYYATPYMKLNSKGELQNNRVEFHRINIDGTDDKVIYVTSQSETNLDWSMYKIDNTPYLVVYEGAKIISINASNGDVKGSASDVTSYDILEEKDVKYTDDRTALNQTHVIFTKDITEGSHTSHAICALNIATGKTETIESSQDKNYSIKHVTKDTIYYTYTSTARPTECLYKKALTSSWDSIDEVKLTNSKYDAYYFADYGNDLIIASGNSSMWRLEGGSNVTPVKLISSTRDVLGIFGDYAYYVSEGKLTRFSIIDGEIEDAFEDGKTTLITNSNFIDFDNRRVYVYASYTSESGESNYYLNYFNERFGDEGIEQRFVGKFESDDVPAKPEQPEPEEGEEVEDIPHID